MRYCILLVLLAVLGGCATSQETAQLQSNITSVQKESQKQKGETNQRISDLSKDVENMRQQVLGLSATMDSHDEKLRTLMGKMDELSHRVGRMQDDLKQTAQARKPPETTAPGSPLSAPAAIPPMTKAEYEARYKDAFEAFQKGQFQQSARLFKDFLESTPETELRPKALYWLGESYIHLKEYDKAILSLQEVADKYPKSDVTPRALLSQAEAFSYARDPKSAETVLKKIVERYPRSEEAAMAERRLKNIDFSSAAKAEKAPAAPAPDRGEREREKPKRTATVSVDAIYLRATPASNARQVVWVLKGTALTVIDESTDPSGNRWFKVKTKAGKEGWVGEKTVKIQEEKE
jgi:tol-pal system protein YbgF